MERGGKEGPGLSFWDISTPVTYAKSNFLARINPCRAEVRFCYSRLKWGRLQSKLYARVWTEVIEMLRFTLLVYSHCAKWGRKWRLFKWHLFSTLSPLLLKVCMIEGGKNVKCKKKKRILSIYIFSDNVNELPPTARLIAIVRGYRVAIVKQNTGRLLPRMATWPPAAPRLCHLVAVCTCVSPSCTPCCSTWETVEQLRYTSPLHTAVIYIHWPKHSEVIRFLSPIFSFGDGL